MAVSTDGLLFTWGVNDAGQLGVGPVNKSGHSFRNVPTVVESLARERVVAIGAGAAHSLAATLDGALFAWGAGGHRQLGLGNMRNHSVPTMVDAAPLFKCGPVRAISCGAAHTAVITAEGELFMAGSDVYGQLGRTVAIGAYATTTQKEVNGSEQRAYVPVFTRVHLERILGDAQSKLGGGGGQRSWRVLQVACGAWHCVALVGAALPGAR